MSSVAFDKVVPFWQDFILDYMLATLAFKLSCAEDSVGAMPTWNEAFHFADGADETVEYEYDANGNMTRDLNRNISSIQYNLLNLPTRITFANYMGDISYTYSAMGEKLAVQYLYGTDRTHGLDAYDFGARTYFADRMQWGQMDPLCEKYYNISPYAYCMNNPVNLIDPIGMEPVYNMDGEFLGTTSEGFTGDVMIYSGFMKINFESFSRKMLEENMSDYFMTLRHLLSSTSGTVMLKRRQTTF